MSSGLCEPQGRQSSWLGGTACTSQNQRLVVRPELTGAMELPSRELARQLFRTPSCICWRSTVLWDEFGTMAHATHDLRRCLCSPLAPVAHFSAARSSLAPAKARPVGRGRWPSAAIGKIARSCVIGSSIHASDCFPGMSLSLYSWSNRAVRVAVMMMPRDQVV